MIWTELMEQLVDLEKDIFCLKRDGNPLRDHAMSFSCLGKLGPLNQEILNRWETVFRDWIRAVVQDGQIPGRPLIVGLAESGIIPSAICHRILRSMGCAAFWICSTRRPANGIAFCEAHSHGPDHVLPVPDEAPDEIWLMEDEITTGRTVLHVAIHLTRVLGTNRVRFFAIADTRSPGQKDWFDRVMKAQGIRYSMHYLYAFEIDDSTIDRNRPSFTLDSCQPKWVHNNGHPGKWLFPHYRPALRAQADTNPELLPSVYGTLLAVGEAVDVGLRYVWQHSQLQLRHVTLSPWLVDGKAIFDRIGIPGGYYIYNPQSLQSPIHLIVDPIDRRIGQSVMDILGKRGYSVTSLTLNPTEASSS